MTKSVRHNYLKVLSFVLATVGMLVGFSQKVIAQYGAPMVRFLLKGTIYAQKTQQTVPDIFVGRNTSGDSVFSDQEGKFAYRTEVDWGTEEIHVFAKDIDGNRNGLLKPELVSAKLSRRPDTVHVDFFLKEEETIQSIIRKNEIPTSYKGKDIHYDQILYMEDSNFGTFFTASPADSASATVFVNKKKLKDNALYSEYLNFEIALDEDVNYMFFELKSATNSTLQQKFNFRNEHEYLDFHFQTNTEYYHGLILVKLTPKTKN